MGATVTKPTSAPPDSATTIVALGTNSSRQRARHHATRAAKSIAGYAYELIHEGSAKARTTSWAPEGGGVVKQVLARHWTSLAAAKDKITGKKAE